MKRKAREAPVKIGDSPHPTLEDILGVSSGEETACDRCGELFLPTEGEYDTSLCSRCRQGEGSD
jgi:formylmethanofuran dehydrogenase subunit E